MSPIAQFPESALRSLGPLGLLGVPLSTTGDNIGYTTEADLPWASSYPVTIIPGQRIKVWFDMWVSNDTANGEVAIRIKEGTTELKRILFSTPVAGRFYSLRGAVVLTPTVGSHTYKLTIQGITGAASSRALATAPAQMVVEDISPSSQQVVASTLPLGILGYASKPSSQTGIGTSDTAITDLSVPVTVGTSRRIKVSAFLLANVTSAADLHITTRPKMDGNITRHTPVTTSRSRR